MSINSWKKEYYKGRLRDAARTPLSAAEHSLTKWRGLRAGALQDHGLVEDCMDIRNPDTDSVFLINSDTCALCALALKSGSLDCDNCALQLSTAYGCGDHDSGWYAWERRSDPELMIQQLEHTVMWLKLKGVKDGHP